MSELTTGIKTAAEAKEISQKNAITIDGIMMSINSQCKNGNTQARFFDIQFPFDVMQQILELGYSISKATGQFKEDITIVSW